MASGYINVPNENPLLVSKAPTLLTDFDDKTFIGSFYSANRMIVFPFATAALHQPVTATWGFCIIYFGGADDIFVQWYFNEDGVLRVRQCFNGTFGTWNTAS